MGLSGEQGMAKLRWGPSYVYLDSGKISPNFTIGLSSHDMPKTMQKNGKKDAPTASGNRSMAARLPPRYEQCWCCGYRNGCGLIRALRMRQDHANKGRMLGMSKYNKIRHDIRVQWLTVQPPENHRHPPADSIGNLVD